MSRGSARAARAARWAKLLGFGVLGWALTAQWGVAETPKPVPAADVDFLEFLGSVDEEEDEQWVDYLRSTDVAAVAKPPVKPVPPKAPAAAEGKK